MSIAEAEVAALQILSLVGEQRGPLAGSLLEQAPMASAHNPRIKHAIRDDGKILLAVQVANWRPFLFILDDARLVSLDGDLPGPF